MPKITIDQIQEGMVVTENICGHSGQVLLGAGVELTEKHLRVLKTWGINVVSVEGDESEGENETELISLPESLIKEVEEMVKPRFRHSNLDHPVVAYLFNKLVVRKGTDIFLHD